MQHLREMIARVARSQAPVHIFGESGTGKELVAKLIHESGPRRDEPFVPVNCGAIPTELMESELFGHKRGSFTGAVSDKKGLIQSAEGGSLFLDEIADLPLHMQVKLLRVIQEKAVRPIGEQQEIEHRRAHPVGHPQEPRVSWLPRENSARTLFYRVNVIELRVPSLRERPEDVPELAEAVLRRLGRRMKITPPMLGKEALAALESLRVSRKRARARKHPGARHYPEHRRRSACRATSNCGRRRIGRRARSAATAPDGGGGLGNQLEDIERDAIVEGAGTDPIQQDGGGQGARHVVPRAAVSHQEARHRMKLS